MSSNYLGSTRMSLHFSKRKKVFMYLHIIPKVLCIIHNFVSQNPKITPVPPYAQYYTLEAILTGIKYKYIGFERSRFTESSHAVLLIFGGNSKRKFPIFYLVFLENREGKGNWMEYLGSLNIGCWH